MPGENKRVAFKKFITVRVREVRNSLSEIRKMMLGSAVRIRLEPRPKLKFLQ